MEAGPAVSNSANLRPGLLDLRSFAMRTRLRVT
jgi:hypothetical protein